MKQIECFLKRTRKSRPIAYETMFGRRELSTAVLVALVLVHAVAATEAAVYRKCCPELQGLSKVTDGLSYISYRCISRVDANRILNGSSVAGAFIVAEVNSVVYGFPDLCTSRQLIEWHFKAVSYSPDAHCLDKVLVHLVNETATQVEERADEVIALGCEAPSPERQDGVSLDVERIRKCCADGHSYDASAHSCRASEDAESAEGLVRRYAAGGLHDVRVGLRCHAGQYAMTYTQERYELTYEGRLLALRHRGSGEVSRLPRDEYCVERSAGGDGALAARGCRDACDAGATCVRKCCPPGQHHEPVVCGRARNKCVDGNLLFTPTFYRGNYMAYKEAPPPGVWGIAPPFQCKMGRFALSNSTEDEHYLLYSGEMVVPNLYNHYATEEYCLETVDRRMCGIGVATEAVLCFQEPDTPSYKFTTSFYVISISCLFLALTFLVYAALPELRNLHGLTLMCHVGSMLLAYSCLARVQFGHIEKTSLCKLLGYGIYFAFVAAFSWLCVMCFDIWWTFGSVKTVQRMGRAGADRRRFAYYSLCAWGAPVVLTCCMLVLDLYPVSPYLDANIGTNFCWFGAVQNGATDWPHYIFFVVPVGALIAVNTVLWVCTARHCARVKSELHRMQAGSFGDRAKRRFRADRAKYTLVVKLWVVMGAGWVWEMLATVVEDPRWLWVGIDLINELQGFFIFVILVLKPKVYFLVRKRLGLEKKCALKKPEGGATSTRSTYISTRSMSAEPRVSHPAGAAAASAAPAPPHRTADDAALRALTADDRHDN